MSFHDLTASAAPAASYAEARDLPGSIQAAVIPAAVSYGDLADMSDMLAELRLGLGLLRGLACEDHLEVSAEQLAWLVDRLLASHAEAAQRVEALRKAPASGSISASPALPVGLPSWPAELAPADRAAFALAFHEEGLASPGDSVGEVILRAMARVKAFLAARQARAAAAILSS